MAMGVIVKELLARNRTTGADVRSVLPNILALDYLVGLTDILVVKHTDCGGLQIRDANVREQLIDLAPGSKAEIEAMKFAEITGLETSESLFTFGMSLIRLTRTLEDSAEDEVAFLRASELLRPELKERTYG
ncbi:uncharacterized protein A1O9_08125 [Exophiala aquamarina CBS 119918]|uniref:Carbonic anhydrase n=1 Tax=Exophiala aquamarina CBS 119918 TaxID=1182545 RepID=A0A072PIP3_9EURO|nr:uncharacterized protein A1O9_08125 [Exophiala aquamarina CBS 119918]KEF55375.1 hypothetical protein A1O9_08125 [Exophiala aquamarina CBS 119918]